MTVEPTAGRRQGNANRPAPQESPSLPLLGFLCRVTAQGDTVHIEFEPHSSDSFPSCYCRRALICCVTVARASLASASPIITLSKLDHTTMFTNDAWLVIGYKTVWSSSGRT